MFPASGNDIELNFNPESFLRNLAIANKARKDFEDGVAGAGARMSSAYEKLSSAMIAQSSRVEQAQNRMVKSLEMRAATAGQSGVERLISERNQLLSQYPKLEDADKKQIDRINRIREAYEKLITVQRKSDAANAGPGGGMIAFRAARDIFEGRTAYGVVQAGQGLSGLGGTAMLAGGLAAGVVALGAASVASMKSLADLGVEINDVKLRTGLTTKQVGEFSFAAKAVGQDVSVFERSMRGLTQAVEDQSSAGDKARGWLSKFGVDISGLRAGTAGTAETFEKIAVGIGSMSSPLERNKAMLDLFKRAGIEIIPVMEQLQKNLGVARDYGFGLTDAEEQKLLHYKDQLVVIEGVWDRITRNIKEHLAEIASLGIGAWDQGGKPPTGLSLAEQSGRAIPAPSWMNLLGGAYMYPDPSTLPTIPGANIPGFGASGKKALQDAMAQENQFAYQKYSAGAGLEGQLKAIEEQRSRLGEVNPTNAWDIGPKAASLDAQIQGLKEQIKLKQESLEVDQKIAKLQTDLSDKIGRPYGITKSEEALAGIAKSPGATQAQIEQTRAMLTASSMVPGFGGSIPLFSPATSDVLMARSRAMNLGQDQLVKALAAMGLGPEGGSVKGVIGEDQTGSLEALIRQNADENKRLTPTVAAQEATLKYSNEAALRSGLAGAQVGGILGAQTPAARMQSEQQIASIRVSAANEELRQSEAMLNAQYKGVEGIEDFRQEKESKLQEARLRNAEEVGKIQDEMIVKQAEELRRQVDEIRKPAEKLFETLFTHPKNFSKEFTQTIHQAAIKPVVDSLSEGTAKLLQPLIFGGGSHTSNGLGSVAVTDGAMHVRVVGGGSGGGGGFNFSSSTGMVGGPASGGFRTGGGAFSIPTPFGPVSVPMFSAGGGTSSFGGGDSSAPGGTSGFSGPVDLAGAAPGVASVGAHGTNQWAGLANIFGGGRGGSLLKGFGQGSSSNMAGILQGSGSMSDAARTAYNLAGTKALASGGTPEQADAAAAKAVQGVVTKGNLESMGKSALSSGGMMLAQQGLLGSSRGTIGGTVEGMFGGAAVGFSVGGPIGAAVGAAAGLGIGVGEMLAGVETPQNQAKRLVSAIYHIGINNAEANQIVQIANSKYGSTVSVAVRSPEVRQMLGLYAAGTGQGGKFPGSADMPHGASLVEQGGQLSQQATYQYGAAFLQHSNLPVASGSPGAQNLPGYANYQPMNLSVNIAGAGIAPFFSGQVVTPDYVSNQWSSAMSNSNNRTSGAMVFDSPGEIVS